MPWNINKIKLWAEIDLFQLPIPFIDNTLHIKLPLEVIQFSADFEMNNIPKASIIVPLGRRMDNLDPSIIHHIINYMRIKLPISVYMQAECTANDGAIEIWPKANGVPTTFRIWDGYTTGSSYQRSMNSAEYVLFMTHWLEDLNFAAMISNLFSPLSPSHYAFMPAHIDFNTGQPMDLVGTTGCHDKFSPNVVVNDFWGYFKNVGGAIPIQGGIKQWFIELSQQDIIVAPEILALAGAQPGDGINKEALKALARIEPIANINPGGAFGNDYLDGVPLALDVSIGPNGLTDAAFTNRIAEQIAEVIAGESLATIASATMWDKLVGQMAPMFMFSVVPQVEKAIVVPYITGLRAPYITIRAEDYDVISASKDMPRMLRAMALAIGVGMPGGGDLPSGQAAPPVDTIGGFFQGRSSGTIKFNDLPPWLTNASLPYLDLPSTLPTPGQPTATGLTPGAGVATGPDYTDLASKSKKVWDRYAQALYMMEILRGRHGQLSGKLRFDIAPGSTVKVEGVEEKYVELGQFALPIFATVLRTSIYINSESQRAGTAFHLSYLREEQENTDDATSVDRHPFWKNVWKGAPLVKF